MKRFNHFFVLPLQWAPTLSKESFYVSQSNASAFDWIECWPWPFSCLWIYGPQGCGKSHLATLWASRHQATFLPLSFTLPISANTHYIIDFQDHDLSYLPEKQIFYFLREIDEKKAHCLWIARLAPSQYEWSLRDLASRLCAMMTASIELPDDTLLGQVLKKSFDDVGWKVSDRTITFLVRRMPRSFASVERVISFIQRFPSPSFSFANLQHIVYLMDQEKNDTLADREGEEHVQYEDYQVQTYLPFI